jgi:hypothetical protein
MIKRKEENELIVQLKNTQTLMNELTSSIDKRSNLINEILVNNHKDMTKEFNQRKDKYNELMKI